MDAQRRPIVAFDVGDRSYTRGKALWAPLPRISRAQATCHIVAGAKLSTSKLVP
jgi:hypothetical protein